MIKLQGKQFDIIIIQAYAPTQNYSNEETEQLYEEIQKVIKYTKSNEALLVMADLSTKDGMEGLEDVVEDME